MKIGSLFSGIGGLELGLERAGLGPVLWQVESDPYARKVLSKHWPHAERNITDVRKATSRNLAPVDLICGGFPCQDLSTAGHGKGHGLDGKQSGLWWEFLDIIRDTEPKWVVVENVSTRWREWVPSVRRGLCHSGYASLPLRVRACDVGAPHQRSRVFVVAYAYGEGEPTMPIDGEMARMQAAAIAGRQDWGHAPPEALGVANGVPHVMDRLRAYGNAVVPACAEVIGRTIVAAVGRGPQFFGQ